MTSRPDGDEENPGYCGDCVSSAIQRVQAWTCGACRTDWCVTVVNPRSYLDHLAATVQLAGARSAIRALLTLADQAPTLTDDELRTRLTALAGRFPPPVVKVPVTVVDDPHVAAVEPLIELARERGFVVMPAGSKAHSRERSSARSSGVESWSGWSSGLRLMPRGSVVSTVEVAFIDPAPFPQRSRLAHAHSLVPHSFLSRTRPSSLIDAGKVPEWNRGDERPLGRLGALGAPQRRVRRGAGWVRRSGW